MPGRRGFGLQPLGIGRMQPHPNGRLRCRFSLPLVTFFVR